MNARPDPQLLLAFLVGWWSFQWYADARGVERTRQTVVALVQPRLASALGAASERPLPHPRALRQARGIGRRRSLDLARYYWLHGPEAPADVLPGIGPTTAAAARSLLEQLGERPAPTVPQEGNR